MHVQHGCLPCVWGHGTCHPSVASTRTSYGTAKSQRHVEVYLTWKLPYDTESCVLYVYVNIHIYIYMYIYIYI